MSRAIGHSGPLLMLAFDHRSSFAREVTGADEVEGSEAASVVAVPAVDELCACAEGFAVRQRQGGRAGLVHQGQAGEGAQARA